MTTTANPTPEQLARQDIDAALTAGGWVFQDRADMNETAPEGRWRAFTHEKILQRDETSLALSGLKDASLEDTANLSAPNTLAREIADDLQSALEQIQDILGDLDARATVLGEEA